MFLVLNQLWSSKGIDNLFFLAVLVSADRCWIKSSTKGYCLDVSPDYTELTLKKWSTSQIRLAFGSSVKPFLFNTICLTLGVTRVFITTNNKSTMGDKNVAKDTLV